MSNLATANTIYKVPVFHAPLSLARVIVPRLCSYFHCASLVPSPLKMTKNKSQSEWEKQQAKKQKAEKKKEKAEEKKQEGRGEKGGEEKNAPNNSW